MSYVAHITGAKSKLNKVDDVYPGGGSSPGNQPGMVGKIKRLTNAQALALSDTSIGTLRGGVYQYGKSKAASSVAPAVGLAAFWTNAADFVACTFTPDPGVTVEGRVAGFYINAVSKGQYGWIQTDGEATVKCKAAVTDTTDGNLAIITTTVGTVDGIGDAGSINTALLAKLMVGVFLEAPVNGALKRILIRFLGRNFG